MGRIVLIKIDTSNLSTDSADKIEALDNANNLGIFVEYLLNLYMQGNLVLNNNNKEGSGSSDLKTILKAIENLDKGLKESLSRDSTIISMLEDGVSTRDMKINFSPQEIETSKKIATREEKKEEIKTKIIVGGNSNSKGKMSNLARLKKLKGDG